LVIGRIESIIIEELLKKYYGLKEINTKVLIEKLKKNTKLKIIFETMNMYRTLATMSILLTLFSLYDIIVHASISITSNIYVALEFLPFVIFLVSYAKQRNKVLECLNKIGLNFRLQNKSIDKSDLK
jgi:hypothetical protein